MSENRFLSLLNSDEKRKKLDSCKENNNKIYKQKNTILVEVNKMWPFKNKNTQRGWAIFFIIFGLLILIVKPMSVFIGNLGLNSFITGLIIAFAGFFYFMDVQ